MHIAKRQKLIAAYLLGVLLIWVPAAAGWAKYLKVERRIERADAMIILSGSEAYRERSLAAAQLYARGVSSTILITNDGRAGGWDEHQKRNPYFAERTNGLLVQNGVPPASIELLPTVVDGTHDEAELIATVSTERGYRSVLLVTSDYHTRRALRAFEHSFATRAVSPDIGIIAAESSDFTAWDWWATWRGWKSVGMEAIKLPYYWIRY